MLFYEDIGEKLKEVTEEYEETIGKRIDTLRKKMSNHGLVELEETIYEVLKDGGILHSGKIILYETALHDNWWNRYITMNECYIGKQNSNNTREQASRLGSKDLIKELMHNGDKIYSELSNYNQKRDKCKRIVELLNEHLTDSDLENDNRDDFKFKKEINKKFFTPSLGEKKLKYIELNVNHNFIDIKYNYGGYWGTKLQRKTDAILLYNKFKEETNELFEKAYGKCKNVQNEIHKVTKIIREEFDYNG